GRTAASRARRPATFGSARRRSARRCATRLHAARRRSLSCRSKCEDSAVTRLSESNGIESAREGRARRDGGRRSYLLAASALESVDWSMEEAAQILGAGRWRTAIAVAGALVAPPGLSGAIVGLPGRGFAWPTRACPM